MSIEIAFYFYLFQNSFLFCTCDYVTFDKQFLSGESNSTMISNPGDWKKRGPKVVIKWVRRVVITPFITVARAGHIKITG